ncbi:DNA adenine methylase [Dichelobacter nodosus]|uniref:DNA adenine methylase n=1 Tax=Dichelobacter nodosus TaxID=870 RepID=UPI0006836E70|nr:DNA adenine methylase [Dichelobacter nodosus]KNZ40128.1 hypothetical protein AKG33_00185 [Dichelobacter nodosus]
MNNKPFKQAPLPFIGQKRMFLNAFQKVLKEHIPSDGAGWTIIDAFGGSGLLSHTAKRTCPKARVIYNDFDGYVERLQHIEDTNRLRRMLFDVLQNQPREKKIKAPVKEAVVQILETFNGYKDINCISSWLLFSGNNAQSLPALYQKTFYQNIRKNDYPLAENYLAGLEITHECYTDLLPRFYHVPNCLFVLDPPYICTDQSSYKMDSYFGLVQFLRLTGFIRPPWIMFSGAKSEWLDYLNFVTTSDAEGCNRMSDYQRINIQTRLNYSSVYEDNLTYKFS